MDPLLAARAQMEVSLAFHMVFAAMGIGMPLLLVVAEGIYLRTHDPRWKVLAKRQARVTALLFAIGAVSGTALSFELSLLWPRFMRLAGPVVGPTFALEGYAFFLEAIFIGLYLYGWDRLSPRAHWLTGIPVAVSGALSGAFVLAVNAWMQTPPAGTTLVGDAIAPVDPWAPFRSPAWGPMAIHSTLACYASVAFAVAGASAWALLKGRARAWHRPALRVAMAVGVVASLLQGLSGHQTAVMVAETQPAKLAAMEAHFETARGADIVIGGVVDSERGEVRGALRIPNGLSLLIHQRPDAEVRGLREFPRDRWPHVGLVHTAFDVMVGCAGLMTAVALAWAAWRVRSRKTAVDEPRWLLRAMVLAAPAGFVALEAGWIVTEAGRQPFTIQGILRTRDAVTAASGVPLTFALFTALYLGLGAIVVAMLRRFARDDYGNA